MRAVTFVPIIPALFLALTILRFLGSPHDEESMLFFGLMIGVCVAALMITSIYAYGPRLMHAITPNRRCPKCYAKLKKDTCFCPKCGNILDNSRSVNLSNCAKCGAKIDDPDRDFCPKCGSMLKK